MGKILILSVTDHEEHILNKIMETIANEPELNHIAPPLPCNILSFTNLEIRLKEQGLRLAELLSHKHTILQRLLTQVMGVDPEQAYEDACAIEHVISADSVAHIQDFLRRYPPRSDQA